MGRDMLFNSSLKDTQEPCLPHSSIAVDSNTIRCQCNDNLRCFLTVSTGQRVYGSPPPGYDLDRRGVEPTEGTIRKHEIQGTGRQDASV